MNRGNGFSCKLHRILTARAFLVAGYLFALLPASLRAVGPVLPGGTNDSSYTPLDSWSFNDTNNWTSDLGYAPVSFTNLSFSFLGNFASLVLNSTNPAWLQYNVYENDGTTNLTVDQGSLTFWFAPGWSSISEGGNGPGEYGRLLEVGAYTPDSSYGWWSIFVDDGGNNVYFSAQTNDLSSNVTTYISFPVSWTTNYFHFIALTYSATNTALYLDGALATNGPPMTVYPGGDVLTNGFFIGGDGVYQAHGMFNCLYTYDVPLDADTIQQIYDDEYEWYMINPLNMAMAQIVSAPSNPSTSPTPDVITGQGNLQAVGSTVSITSSNFWLANVSAFNTNGTMGLIFTIQGGYDNVPYDVFANSILDFSSDTNKTWAWMGQGFHGYTYMLTNLPPTACFLILGGTNDFDSDGLTDAYERLVSKTDPHNPNSNLDGISDGWEILLGLNPQVNNFTSPAQRSNYGYSFADWLNTVSGVRIGTVDLDNEGNVKTVSQ